ncbi:PIN domain-containing protein [Janthinobacterium tructae]|uniref:PIN domain-containing protein n=1 Tax=Janthinobacterium tructae TaxID=2590869 RepID=A0A4Y6R931_9BURK|nr:PIN domain-containing protein [Janthinobacterium tructae]QDG69010.1 hypothetical protein FJQ89_00210 [Janthinobacterium tructae]
MNIEWGKYAVIAFIDSNVALECLALEQLPWREIEGAGSVLILVTPTVMQEVDSKKNHARLGDHARRFNRTLRPLLTGNETVVVRSSPAPVVEVALADCGVTDWNSYPDFDREEADARVVVQAHCARGPDIDKCILISHDIRPLYLARQLGLKVYQIGDNWLRPKEVSESEKKAGNLQRELNSLKSREPKLEVLFEASAYSVDTYRITSLSSVERKEIEQTIVGLNPIPMQERSGPLSFSPFDYDSSLDGRYSQWEKEVIPNFMQEYERKLELNFGQVEVRFRINNVGQVPAEALLIRLTASGGWLNERYVLASPCGPHAPKPRFNHFDPMHGLSSKAWMQRQPGTHEFIVIEPPDRTTQVQISCQDFRHGFEHEYTLIGWVDPHADGLSIRVVVTASNLHGDVCGEILVRPCVTDITASDLVELDSMKFRQPPPVVELLKAAGEVKDHSAFELDGSDWDK